MWASNFLKIVDISENSRFLSSSNAQKRLVEFTRNAEYDCHTSSVKMDNFFLKL
jgi:hypothetical protein